jgi:hypothetical protein
MRVPLPGCLKVVMPAPGAHARHENAAEEERFSTNVTGRSTSRKTAFYQQSMPRTQSATQLKVGLLPE